MRSAPIVSFFAPVLLSGIHALPVRDGDPCSIETVTQYVTEEPSSITGVPAPEPSDNPSQKPYPMPTIIPPDWITGVPAPSSSTSCSNSSWITGVPAPSSGSGWITGVSAPSSSSSWITGVPDPSSSCESSSSWITGVPAPSSSSQPSNATSSSTSSSVTSSTPSSTPTSSCRPTWVNSNGHAPSIGKLRAAAIFVDFPDFPANTTTNEIFEPIKSQPAELYKTMSYGKLDLEIVPVADKFFRMPADSSSYGYARDLTTEMHLKYINDALTAVGPDVSFRDFDVLYIIPAKYASEISFSTSTGIDVKAMDGSTIGATITYGQDLYFAWEWKTINHETGHAMGLPDLYPYDGGEVPKWVGGFDLMGLIKGQSPDFFAWHKWRLGWIEDSQVDCVTSAGTTRHRISPIEVADETRNSPKAIAIPVNGTQYIMAEVRSELGINKGACGTGVLLYTGDSSLSSGDGPVRVVDTKPGSNGCGNGNDGGELNDAPLAEGEFDTGLGVMVRVVGQEWNDYIIEVERK